MHRTREAMKKKKKEELGSWERAVTVADGAWMTRGHHSENFTFSIRDFFTGKPIILSIIMVYI